MNNTRAAKPVKNTVTKMVPKRQVHQRLPGNKDFSHKYHLNFLLPLAIILFTFSLFVPSLKNDFVNWDDKDFIHKDKVIFHLKWENVKEICTSFNYDNYHPLTTLSHAVEYAFVGTKSAFLYHFDNLLLHLVNVLLVFLLFRILTRNLWMSSFIALLFAIHPMHVESVVWAAERKDVLYSCFFLIAGIFYCKYLNLKTDNSGNLQAQSWNLKVSYLLLTLLFFFLSLLSKSAAVVFPLLMLLLDYFSRRKINWKMVLEKIPFFTLSVMFGIIAILSQHKAIQKELDYTLIQRFFLINYAILKYIIMLIFPTGLSAFHAYPEIRHGFNAFAHLSPLVNLGILAFALFTLKFTRRIVFGLLFFIINLLLVLQILPVGGAIISERYTYIAYLGLFYLIAFYFVEYLGNQKSNPVIKGFLVIIASIFFFVFVIITSQRMMVWKNSYSLWTDAVEKSEGNHYMPVFMLGNALKEVNDFDKAMECFNKAYELNSGNTAILINRGNLLFQKDKFDAAYKDFEKAIKLDTTVYEAYNNRGVLRGRNGDYTGSLSDLDRAIRLKSDYDDALRNRGVTKVLMGDKAGGLKDWREAIKLGNVEARALYKQVMADTSKQKNYNLKVNVKD